MPQMRPETKKRIQTLFKYSKTAFHWGFIPLIIYLGLKQGGEPGMPEPNLLSISMKAAILKSREQAKIDFLIRQSSGSENWLFLAKNSIKTKISPGILNRVEMKQL
ncbi:Mitochondrial import receptor subunit TOM7-like protein [Acropora cervicornis]|uniref:Mitochondrial import receptor subunit TOM7 homolog n=1 Tax=Acropora cervicornis TaxID=6130 RepID=A0AAD9QPJ6_ACRCE|nr:Mitochondrial import receptor subunit TOM7-like protein [Acropora cervicornis]